MTSNTVKDIIPIFFGSTKKMNDERKIGQFGIGLYACLRYADSVEILTRTENASNVTRAILLKSGIIMDTIPLQDISIIWQHPGTQIKLLLDNNAPITARDPLELIKYINSVFLFSPVDIYINSKPVVGPNFIDLPWKNTSRTISWMPLQTDDNIDPTKAILHIIRKEHTVADLALYLMEQPIPNKQRGIRLFVKRILVDNTYIPMGNQFLANFITGVINAHRVDVTLARNAVVKGSSTYIELEEFFFHTLGVGIQEWAEQNPITFEKFVAQHRDALLYACSHSELLFNYLKMCIPFRTYNGSWEKLSSLGDNPRAYYAGHLDQFNVLPRNNEKLLDVPIFLFETVSEKIFLDCLRKGIGINLEWKPIDELAVSSQGESHYFQANQVMEALKSVLVTTNHTMPHMTLLKSKISTVQSEVTKVEVISAPRDRRIAWFVPQLKPGIRENDILNQARDTVLGWGRSEADSGFDEAVRRQVHEIGYEKVLYLNYSHGVIQIFFKVLGSMKVQDQQVAGSVLAGLLCIAQNESFDDWTIWINHFTDNAKQLINLIILILDNYDEPDIKKRNNDNE